MLALITNRSRNPLNAIPPGQPPEPADRTTRHLRLCAELADLAMQLARAAAARTFADWAEPEPLPTEPADPPADRAPAPHPAPRRPASAASHKSTDPAVLFTRLAATVRDCIALESRLAAGVTSAQTTFTLRADPRRALLREAFGIVTKNHPDRAALQREATTRLDERLANDPDQTLQPARFLIEICEDLGIPLDIGKLADKFLFTPKKTAPTGNQAPNPRATSPPP
jgi:hypothetical protein